MNSIQLEIWGGKHPTQSELWKLEGNKAYSDSGVRTGLLDEGGVHHLIVKFLASARATQDAILDS